jgi:hypothetical protein
MLPLLLFELMEKRIYLTAFALPRGALSRTTAHCFGLRSDIFG